MDALVGDCDVPGCPNPVTWLNPPPSGWLIAGHRMTGCGHGLCKIHEYFVPCLVCDPMALATGLARFLST